MTSSPLTVQINAFCANEGRAGARAGYGVYAGEGGPFNSSGSVIGAQTTDRAMLTAVEKALEVAIQKSVPSIRIISEDDELIGNLRYDRRSNNQDVMDRIKTLKNQIPTTFVADDIDGAPKPLRLAKIAAGAHSTSKNPLNDGKNFRNGIPLARVHGRVDAEKDEAFVTIISAPNGFNFPEVSASGSTLRQAALEALNTLLQWCNEEVCSELIIVAQTPEFADAMRGIVKTLKDGTHENNDSCVYFNKFMDQIETVFHKFETIIIEPPALSLIEQTIEDFSNISLLRESKPEKSAILSVNVIEYNTKAEYTIFWGLDDPRNHKTIVEGDRAEQRVALAGLLRLLEQADANSEPHVVTDSRYIQMVRLFRAKWKAAGWKMASGEEVFNKEGLIRLDALMAKFKKVTIEYYKSD